ncbi:HIT family protein [Candidatus Daviesbacteria bacterium]|nr:HIT family protein [Candidatus Daviesbacteria bacterium]
MEDCIFCKIIIGDIPSNRVHEDEDVVAFLELHPSAPGHVMVIHRRHGKTVLDYSEKELGKIMTGVQKVAEKVEKGLKCNSITIGINHNERRGVPHLHIHLVPRWEGDRGGIIQTVVNNPPQDSPEVIAEKIRKAT